VEEVEVLMEVKLQLNLMEFQEDLAEVEEIIIHLKVLSLIQVEQEIHPQHHHHKETMVEQDKLIIHLNTEIGVEAEAVVPML
jgi:hypothetical protein